MDNTALITVLVCAIRLEAQGVASLELRSPQGDDLPAFEAGAHIDLHLPNGLVRSYSLFNAPTERHRYMVAVQNDRNSRGGSRFVHEQLRVGSELRITPPRNNFALDESAPRSVLLAGGIGVTPLFCMYKRLRSIGQPVELIYCARSRKEAAFVDDGLLSGNSRVRMLFDDEHGGPPDLRILLSSQPKDAHFYCCGPAPMLDAFETVCKGLGYANVHIERFSAPADMTPSQASGYQVELARSGKIIDVPPETSLLNVLIDAGIDTDYSCREGICGACQTTVLEGIPDHRDAVLTERERASNKTMMICVSGCKGDKLVLDI